VITAARDNRVLLAFAGELDSYACSWRSDPLAHTRLHVLVEIGSEALSDAVLRHATEPMPVLEALTDLRSALDQAGREPAPHRARIIGVPGRSIALRDALSLALRRSIRTA
jgi:hypothetical protein